MIKKTAKNHVRERLIEYIQAHSSDPQLPPLRTISRDLEVSIYLIRKQLDTLQREGILKRRTRIGVFLTPRQLQIPTIGMITNPGSSDPYIDVPEIYAGVLSALARQPYLVRSFDFKHYRDIPKRVLEMGISGLIWVEPRNVDLVELVRLVCGKHRIPMALCGENFYRYTPFRDFSNLVSLDYEAEARLRAQYFVCQGKKRLAYCAIATASLPVFREELRRHGIDLPEECVISDAERMPERLPEIVQKYRIDGILCDGSPGFYENLFAFLHQHPDFRPLLSVENHPRVHCQLRKYPEIKLDFQFEPWGDFYFRQGERAVDMLIRSMSGERVQKGEKYCFSVTDPNFRQWHQNFYEDKTVKNRKD